MKVMILVPLFSQGSPVVGAFLFAKYLREKSIDVVFVTLEDNYNSKKNIISNIAKSGIKFECVKIEGWWGVIRKQFSLQKYVRDNCINVIVSYMLRPDLLTSNITGVVKISSVRGMLREQYPLLYGKTVANVILHFQIKAWNKFDHIWSMTKTMNEWLIEEGMDTGKVSIVNNFVDVRSIRTSVENVRLDSNINIGLFCSLIPRKRVETAIKAIGKLFHDFNHSNLRLQIAGSGDLFSSLKQLTKRLNIEEIVVFNGFLEEHLSFMGKMDLILLTSEAEGVPRCLMEALSLGKTIIATNIPGVRNLINDKHTGYLFPVGDVDRLSVLIDNIIKNKLYLPSDRLVNFMMENNDVSRCCEKMLGKINQLHLNQKGS